MFERAILDRIAKGGNEVLDFLEKELPFAGGGTFLKLPRGRELKGVDIAVAGIPFDGGTTYRPGARLGPRAIREQSAYVSELQPCFPWDLPLSGLGTIRDFGDIVPPPSSLATEILLGLSEATCRTILGSGASLLCLGGDHTVSYGPIRAAARQFGPLALIHLDAHQDCLPSSGFVPGLRLVNHATFAHDVAEEGSVVPQASIQAYIRTRMEKHPKAPYRVVDAFKALDKGAEALAREVRDLVGSRPVYLTLDIDTLDPAFAPGTGTPVPGGPSSAELRRFLKALDGINLVAADLVETNPTYDPSQTTAIVAAYLAFDLLQLLSSARRKRP